jgi:phosphate transport system substrate-binding protein
MRTPLTFLGTLFVALALTVAPAAGQSAGGGAEIPAVAFKQWCVMVTSCTYEVHDADLDLDKLRTGKVDWIGVDEPLNAAQLRQAGGPVTYVPMMLGALAVVANPPGTDGHHLRLSGPTIGRIFAGEITAWGDGRIQRENRRHSFTRTQRITLCVPAQASGSSWDMSTYLARVSPSFRQKVGGPSLKPKWRGSKIIRVADVASLGDCVAANPGAISFLDLGEAKRHGQVDEIVAVGKPERVTYGTGKNKKTVVEMVYRHPTSDGMAIAGRVAQRTIDRRLMFDPINVKAEGAYPITVGAWVAFRSDRRMSPGTRKALRAMLGSTAQGRLQGLGYAPLPNTIRTKGLAAVNAAR